MGMADRTGWHKCCGSKLNDQSDFAWLFARSSPEVKTNQLGNLVKFC